MALKANAYITLEEAGNWLKIKLPKLGIPTPTAETDTALIAALELLINAACQKVETYIRTNVLAKEFVEYNDGDNSNTLSPKRWPLLEIVELNIDTNRIFIDDTKVDEVNYFLRGATDSRQDSGDLVLRVIGQDIVIRDDNEKFILGRIFMGSTLGSVKLTYKAGWALTADDVPSDIKIATLQIIEFYYYQRDNRDIGIASKSVKGESYQKNRDELPEQIFSTLDPYQDVSIGDHVQPQRNTFSV